MAFDEPSRPDPFYIERLAAMGMKIQRTVVLSILGVQQYAVDKCVSMQRVMEVSLGRSSGLSNLVLQLLLLEYQRCPISIR